MRPFACGAGVVPSFTEFLRRPFFTQWETSKAEVDGPKEREMGAVVVVVVVFVVVVEVVR